ncbi:MAG TPA: lysylphosphatidylglycerol synthase transmembrane domain-containing protein [Gemmatimonadales bacterium]|nr:lysylphosphatidylglycerol synthase transmembrane domain-containing protein [Gemmatimonadales bacterium]
MSRRARLLLFAAGSVVFAYLISRVGVRVLIDDARATGWMFLPIVLLYGLAYACNAGAWALVMAGEPRHPPYGRVYVFTVAGFALNFVTPMINVGGEPYRMAAVAPWLGIRRAAGSVILHNVLRGLSFLLSWLTALGLAFFMLPSTPVIRVGLTIATLVLVVLAALLFSGHRRGALEKTLDVLHRIPLLRRVGRALEPRREVLVQVDAQIADFYHHHPGRFGAALALEYLSRVIYMSEYYLIGLSIGISLNYFQGYMVGNLSSLFQNLLFFIPFEVGSKEASLYVLFDLMHFDPQLGFYTAIVTRLRDLVWIGIGLLLVWNTGQRAAAPRPETLP